MSEENTETTVVESNDTTTIAVEEKVNLNPLQQIIKSRESVKKETPKVVVKKEEPKLINVIGNINKYSLDGKKVKLLVTLVDNKYIVLHSEIHLGSRHYLDKCIPAFQQYNAEYEIINTWITRVTQAQFIYIADLLESNPAELKGLLIDREKTIAGIRR